MDNVRFRPGRRSTTYFLAASIAVLSVLHAIPDAGADGTQPWLVQYLQISLDYRDRSAYREADERSVQSLQLYTSDTSRPGFAFRCEKHRLFAWVSLKPLDLEKTLKKKVVRPRDWPLAVTIGNRDPVEEDWVSMFSGRVYMVRETGTTKDVFLAAVSGVPVDVSVKKRDPVRIEAPAADTSVVKYFLQRCDLDDPYQPDIDLRDAPEKLPPGVLDVESVEPVL